jgi:hypothetical protein
MPTHFAYLKRITPAYWRSEPDSRYLWISLKNAICKRVGSSIAAFGRVKRDQIGLHCSPWLIEMTD